jgi:hypothetical protein
VTLMEGLLRGSRSYVLVALDPEGSEWSLRLFNKEGQLAACLG